MTRKPAGDDKPVADLSQPVDVRSYGWVVAAKAPDVVPNRESIQASVKLSEHKNATGVFVDFDGSDGSDSQQFVGEDSAARAAEQVKGI